MKQKLALIIVDLNNDFMPGGALAVKRAEEVLAPINYLTAEGGYDFIVATQDWHPIDHASFRSWPPHCVAGTPGADLHPLLDMSKVQALIRTGFDQDRDSYSGFFDELGHSNGLGELLRARGMEAVDVVGLATDYCVQATAIDAAQKVGLKTRVLLDACRGIELQSGDTAAAIENMRSAGVEIIPEGGLGIPDPGNP